jgi:hypothetical protein
MLSRLPRTFGRFAPSAARPAPRKARRFLLSFESLEDRTVMYANINSGAASGMDAVFASGTAPRGNGYTVAVIDSGINYNLSILGGGFGPGHRVVAGKDFANNDNDPMDDTAEQHGTNVAAIIGSSDPTYSGVAPEVNFVALKVANSSGTYTDANLEAALQWVLTFRTTYNIVAVNMSLEDGNQNAPLFNPKVYADEELSLISAGVVVVASSGNGFSYFSSNVGLSSVAFPLGVVSVGATWTNSLSGTASFQYNPSDTNPAIDTNPAQHKIAAFSQRRNTLSIVAPGTFIRQPAISTTNDFSGTSAAAPFVAGAAVLVRQKLAARGATDWAANASFIHHVLGDSGAPVTDATNANDNVINTGLTFPRLRVDVALTRVEREIFIRNLYNDFLGRLPTTSDLNFWVAQYDIIGQSGVTNSIMRSDESLNRMITNAYTLYLNRSPSSSDLAFWRGQFATHTLEYVLANIAASDEAFSGQSQGSYVNAMYLKALGRTASTAEQNFWIGTYNLGTAAGRYQFMVAIFGSGEYRTYAAHNIYGTIPSGVPVLSYLRNLLHRSGSSGDITFWVNSGYDLLGMEAYFASTSEYFARSV